MLFYTKVPVSDSVKIDLEPTMLLVPPLALPALHMHAAMGALVLVPGVVALATTARPHPFVLRRTFVFRVPLTEVVQPGLAGDKVLESNLAVEPLLFLLGVSAGMRGFVVDSGLFETSIVPVAAGVELGERRPNDFYGGFARGRGGVGRGVPGLC